MCVRPFVGNVSLNTGNMEADEPATSVIANILAFLAEYTGVQNQMRLNIICRVVSFWGRAYFTEHGINCYEWFG